MYHPCKILFLPLEWNIFSLFDFLTMSQSKNVLKLSSIANFFAAADERRLLARGENAVKSIMLKVFILCLKYYWRVKCMLRDRFCTVEVRHKYCIFIFKLIHAQTMYKNRMLQVNLFKDGEIKDVSCTCPRG